MNKIVGRRLDLMGFWALQGLFVLSAALFTGYFIRELRNDALDYQARTAELEVRSLEVQVSDTVQRVDQMMRRLAEDDRITKAENAPHARSSALNAAIVNLPGVRSLSIVDASGRVIASTASANQPLTLRFSSVVPAPGAADGGLQIAVPWDGNDFCDATERGTSSSTAPASRAAQGAGFVPLLRTIRHAGAEYTLVVALGLEAVSPNEPVRPLVPQGEMYVLRSDGLALQAPALDMAHMSGVLEWMHAGASARTMGIEDDVRRGTLTVFQKSLRYPLVVVLRLDRREMLTTWRRDALRIGLLATGMTLLLSACAALFFFQQRRLIRERTMAIMVEKERLGMVLDAIPAMVFMVGADGRYSFINRAGRRFFQNEGLRPNESGEYDSDTVNRYLYQTNPAAHERIAADIGAMVAGAVDHVFSEHFVNLRDGLRWHQLQGRRVESPGSREVVGPVLMVLDITDRKATETQLQLAASVFEVSAEGILVTDAQQRVLSVNAAFTEITGYSGEEMIGRNPRLLASGQHDRHFYAAMWAALQESGRWQGEIVNRRKNGQVYPEWLTISVVRDEQGGISNFVGVFTDITERKASEERIRHLSEHDFLTGLPNRILFEDRVSHAIANSARKGYRFALLFIDLDRFKTVNDTLGHHIGDLLLKEIARRFSDCVRASDTISRQGGDEFLVLLENIERPEDAGRVAEKLLERLSAPARLDGNELRITPSIGIALYPEDGRDMTTLIKHADVAMYYSKEHGRNSFHYFTATMNATANERLMLEHGLRRAMAGGIELEMHYQPLISLDANRIVGAEALMRWQHPELGAVSPLKFISVAEECGLIVPLGQWALRQVCRQGAAWRAAGLTDLTLAVNVAAPQFAQEDFLQIVQDILAETGYPPEWLEFEVTESLLIVSSDTLIANIEGLRGLGIRLAIDDFGTGYSSLAYLRKLPIYKLKIDRSFVRDVDVDADDAVITSAIVKMAHSIGLRVLAEGVETAGQLSFLRDNGCNEAQGFFFSPALPASAFVDYLHTMNSGQSGAGS